MACCITLRLLCSSPVTAAAVCTDMMHLEMLSLLVGCGPGDMPFFEPPHSPRPHIREEGVRPGVYGSIVSITVVPMHSLIIVNLR